MGKVESTYKARDVEEIIDIHFYRPWGYALAVGAHRLGMTPNQISVFGMFVGIASGHLFYYVSPWINAIGVFLWMLGQALDGADGQLARMTNTRSRLGRMLDGISDGVKFISLYAHVGLRLYESTGNWWILVIVFVAALTHSWQSSLADYARNAYLFFVEKPGKAEIENSVELQADHDAMPWKGHIVERILLGMYVGYTERQEWFSKRAGGLYACAMETYGGIIPEHIQRLYRSTNRHLLKYYNALTTNTRMVVFFSSLILGNFWIYFTFELIGLNALMLLMMFVVQKRADAKILAAMSHPLGDV